MKNYFKSMNDGAQIVSEKDRVLKFKISDESVDRAGDIIRQAGWNFEPYRKNPVIQFAHEYGMPPIGKALFVHSVLDNGSPYSWAEVKFPEEGSYEFADTIYKLAKPPEQFIRTTSVGFIGKKINRVEDEEERKSLGLGTHGVVFEEQELLEISIVPVPANPNAISMAVQKGIISSKEATWVDNVFGSARSTLLKISPQYSGETISFTYAGSTSGNPDTNNFIQVSSDLLLFSKIEEIKESIKGFDSRLEELEEKLGRFDGVEVSTSKTAVKNADLYESILRDSNEILEKVHSEKKP